MSERKRLPHLFVRDAAQTENYIYPGGGGQRPSIPARDRQRHSRHLLQSLKTAEENARRRQQDAKTWAVPAKKGVHLEFESEPGFDLELDSLDSTRPNDLQLVNVREKPGAPDVKLATVFVPEGKLQKLESKLQAYASEDTSTGKPRNQKLAEKIAQIRLAHLLSFWTDDPSRIPSSGEAIWWEVWLRRPEEGLLRKFQATMEALGVKLGKGSLAFPSTRVVLAYGTLKQLSQSIEVVESIAELRQAKEAASFFMQQTSREMADWVLDLVERTTPPSPDAPRICILDTGVNAGHPLLRLAVDPSSLQSVNLSWGTNDHDGHGTGMAGLALFGDLAPLLTRVFCMAVQFFRLPWPIEQLRDLGETIVQLRVTLSYFIEPNPSERGHRTRHRYASHGFRFDVRAATETFEDFRKRLTKAARAEGEGSPGTSDTSGWTLGSDRRHRGSLHSDIWEGTAAELADRHDLAVYPVSGWWKERHQIERWKRRARYALVVSILAPEIEVDLYTPVSTSIQIPISVTGRS